MQTAQPLPVQGYSFVSNNEDEVTEFVRQRYVDNRLRFSTARDGTAFTALTAETPSISSDRLTSTIDFTGEIDPLDYLLFVEVRGGTLGLDGAGGTTQLVAGDAALYPMGVPVRFDVRNLRMDMMRVPLHRVEQAAEETTGIAAGELHFDGTAPVSASMHAYCISLLRLVNSALMAAESPMSHALIAENAANTVATMALHTFPNTAMTQAHVAGPGYVAPASVRRAVAFLDANAEHPLRLSDVAAAAGTSTRALQYGFQRHLGTTPLGYLRRVRLEHVHRDLHDGDPTRGDTVAAIAGRWGFTALSRFAAAYHQNYGVLPSHTLRR